MKRLKESGWEDEVKKMVHKIIKEKVGLSETKAIFILFLSSANIENSSS